MAAREDRQFAKGVFAGTVNAVAAYQEHQFELLDDGLTSMPMTFRKVPFWQHIIESTPILALRA